MDDVEPITFGVTFNLNLQSQSPWSLLSGTWQTRPRDLEHGLRFEIEMKWHSKCSRLQNTYRAAVGGKKKKSELVTHSVSGVHSSHTVIFRDKECTSHTHVSLVASCDKSHTRIVCRNSSHTRITYHLSQLARRHTLVSLVATCKKSHTLISCRNSRSHTLLSLRSHTLLSLVTCRNSSHPLITCRNSQLVTHSYHLSQLARKLVFTGKNSEKSENLQVKIGFYR